MHRPILFLSTCLCLAAAGALIVAAGLRQPVATAQPPTAYGEITRGFYDAINTAIATGNSSFVRAYVDEDLFRDDRPLGVASGVHGLEALLADLHATAPDTRLEVADIDISGSLVNVALQVHHRSGSFLGFPITVQPLPWTSVDRLRIRSGKIVEWRSPLDGTGILRPGETQALQVSGPVTRVIALERITLPPGRSYTLPIVLNARALMSREQGVQAEITMTSSNTVGTVQSQTDVVSVTDELLIIPATKPVTVANKGPATAHLLQVTLASPIRSAATTLPTNGDPAVAVEHRTLAGGTVESLPEGALGVAAGRFSLVPSGEFALGATEGVALIYLDAGEVTVSHRGAIKVNHVNGGVQSGESEEHLVGGMGLLVESGTSFTMRNGGSETAEGLVFTITSLAS